MTQKTLVILAAGMGSRYGGVKQIEAVGAHGELIIDYSVFDAIRAGFNKFVFVIRPDIEKDFCEIFFNRIKRICNDNGCSADYCFQDIPNYRKKPMGTAPAVLAARKLIDQPFCVISADDFYGYEAFKLVQPSSTIGYRLIDTLSSFGTVNRGVIWTNRDGNVTAIRELKCTRMGDKIGYVDGDFFSPLDPETLTSMVFFCFEPNVLPMLQEKYDHFLLADNKSMTGECILSVVTSELINEGKITFRAIPTKGTWVGFTYPEDKPKVQAEMNRLIAKGDYPSPLWPGVLTPKSV